MSARKPAVRPLCGTCEQGWIYDDETGTTARCPCRRPQATPEAERDAALAATTEAHTGAHRDALRIIREHALRMDRLSSNDTRWAMAAAQIPGPVVGAAFRQAAHDGLIRRDGYVPSTDAGTHAHPVAEYMSLIYRGRVAS